MISDVYQILKDLKYPSSYPEDSDHLMPAASLAQDATVRTILTLAGAANRQELTNTPEPDSKTKFYLFLLAVNEHFSLKHNKPTKGKEQHLKALADTLEIGSGDYEAVMTFYHANKPYTDTDKAVYNAFEQANQLIRSKGIHIYFTNRTPGEVIYLKYIEHFDLFLSKTFISGRSPNAMDEEISIKELNVVTEKNYKAFHYDMPSFNELKTRIKQFVPLQRVEVSQTGSNPRISLDPEKGMVSISGASSPISTTSYFEPIFEWLDLFSLSGKDTLSIYFHFKYYNTYTTKFLVSFVWKSNKLVEENKTVSFYWYYDMDDDEMREFGEYLQTQFLDKEKFYLLETF